MKCAHPEFNMNIGCSLCPDRNNCESYGTPAEDRYGRDVKPDKVKSLAQYLNEYIDHEIENRNIDISNKGITMLSADYNSWRELIERALDAYQSTEQVKIRIERV